MADKRPASTPGLPGWIAPWCDQHLGAAPVASLLRAGHLSAVFGLRLADGREVVIKARRDRVVYDWDSLAWMPEPVLVGSASGVFANAEVPTLAPLESSAAFIESYQLTRGHRFSTDELELAWAASLWTTTHNARAEALLGQPRSRPRRCARKAPHASTSLTPSARPGSDCEGFDADERQVSSG